jgi:PAS domain S-box-containing protein
MKRDWTSQFRNSAAHCFFGSIGLVLLTFVCFRLKLDLATTGFAYLTLIAVLPLNGSFIGSVVLSIFSVGFLNYFFAPPLFTLQVEYPQDILALTTFLTTSLVVTALTAKARRAADEARASQKALADTIPALVWSALPDGSRDFHSRRWLEFTGLSAEEASGKGWSAVLHPQDRAAFVDKWRSSVATGESFETETRGRSANGEYRWFLARAEPLRDERGTIVRWYGSNTDIEDRKRATEALRESEEQWREVFEHNPVMYFMVDATGTVLSVNNFGAAQLGYAVSELVGQSVLSVFYKEDREFVQKNVAVCLDKLGQSHSWEIRKVRKDGTVLWVRENAKAVRRADNQLIVLVACEDITERKRTEDALRLSEAYMAHAQQLASVGSWAYRRSSMVEHWDICEHWSAETWHISDFDPTEGYPPIDAIFLRIHPEDRERVAEANTRALKDGQPMNVRYRYFRADGQLRILHSIGTAVFENGAVTRFVGASLDITEQERRIEELRRADEELHQTHAQLAHISRVTTLGELTASIAHEVNQPLAGVVSSGNACLHWLASQPPDVDKARQSVERVIRDANRASEVVGRVRGLAKKAPPQKVWLNINETVLEIIALTRREVEQSHVSLRTQLSDDVPLVWADRIQLQQVILNLIINAIEAISALGDGPRDVLVSTAKDKSNDVLLTVRDSGAGLDPGKLEDIFNAFYTTKTDGMGMGLAVSRSIIMDHGGRLWATPNEPRGAVFQFTLPAGREEAS